MNVRELSAGDIQFDGQGSSSEQQRSVLEATAVVQLHRVGVGLDPQDSAAGEQIDASLCVPIRWTKGDPFLRCGASEIILGNIRAIIGSVVIGRHDRDRPFVTLAPEHFRRGKPGGTTPDNQNGCRGRRGQGTRGGRGCGSRDKQPAATLLDGITLDGIDGRCANGFSRARTKTGVVPGAVNGRSIEETLIERTAIVRALRSHGAHVGLFAGQ